MRYSSVALRAGMRSCGTELPDLRDTVFFSKPKRICRRCHQLTRFRIEQNTLKLRFYCRSGCTICNAPDHPSKIACFDCKRSRRGNVRKDGKILMGGCFYRCRNMICFQFNIPSISSPVIVLPRAFPKNPAKVAPGTATNAVLRYFSNNIDFHTALEIRGPQSKPAAFDCDKNTSQHRQVGPFLYKPVN